MQTLELETMRCELDGHLGRLRLNRPQALNAANWAWVEDLVTATTYLAQSNDTHVVIVSGEGRAFCSGLDKKELSQGKLTREYYCCYSGVLSRRGFTSCSGLRSTDSYNRCCSQYSCG